MENVTSSRRSLGIALGIAVVLGCLLALPIRNSSENSATHQNRERLAAVVRSFPQSDHPLTSLDQLPLDDADRAVFAGHKYRLRVANQGSFDICSPYYPHLWSLRAVETCQTYSADQS